MGVRIANPSANAPAVPTPVRNSPPASTTSTVVVIQPGTRDGGAFGWRYHTTGGISDTGDVGCMPPLS